MPLVFPLLRGVPPCSYQSHFWFLTNFVVLIPTTRWELLWPERLSVRFSLWNLASPSLTLGSCWLRFACPYPWERLYSTTEFRKVNSFFWYFLNYFSLEFCNPHKHWIFGKKVSEKFFCSMMIVKKKDSSITHQGVPQHNFHTITQPNRVRVVSSIVRYWNYLNLIYH